MCVNEGKPCVIVKMQGAEVVKINELKCLESIIQSNGQCTNKVKKWAESSVSGDLWPKETSKNERKDLQETCYDAALGSGDRAGGVTGCHHVTKVRRASGLRTSESLLFVDDVTLEQLGWKPASGSLRPFSSPGAWKRSTGPLIRKASLVLQFSEEAFWKFFQASETPWSGMKTYTDILKDFDLAAIPCLYTVYGKVRQNNKIPILGS